jgi:hypothetical protein
MMMGLAATFLIRLGDLNLGHPAADKCSCTDTHLIVSGSIFTCVDIVDFFYDIWYCAQASLAVLFAKRSCHEIMSPVSRLVSESQCTPDLCPGSLLF